MSDGLAVFAPRGWQCLQLTGSNGSTLVVTPERHSLEDMHGLRGSAVQISLSYGGTSGRFEVADVIARYFPEHMAFARRVAAEWILDRPLPSGPFPADRIRRPNATVVRFTTPARRLGMGTNSLLAPDADPIQGLVVLLDHEDGPDILQLSVRLPHRELHPTSAIIGAVSHNPAAAIRAQD